MVVDRHLNNKGSALSLLAFYGDCSFRGIHNLLNKSQAHARTHLLHLGVVLIERFEDAFQGFFTNTLTCIGHSDNKLLVFASHQNANFAIGRRELKGVRKQVVNRLNHISRHKIHYNFVFSKHLQIYLMALCIVVIALHNHSHKGHDVAVAPIGIAQSRLDFGYIEQLVDEC